MAISRSIVEAVRSMSPPGRFLEKNTETGLWSDIGDRKATEKTSQALRDGAATLRKQLSADLGDPDFLSAVFDMDSAANNRAAEKKTDDAKSSKVRNSSRFNLALANASASTEQVSQEGSPKNSFQPGRNFVEVEATQGRS